MTANQAVFPIRTMARVLKVSPAGYYAWKSRQPSVRARADAELLRRIRTIHAVSQGTYGAPRIHAELQAKGIHVGEKRVARLMRQAGITGVSRRRATRTTIRDRDERPAPDLVDRDFRADAANQLWVADVTYVPTVQGWLYLACVTDVFSRMVIGWSMASHRKTDLVVDAVTMAAHRRGGRVPGVIHHSDRGGEYSSHALERELRRHGALASMGSVADCFDNALAESVFATLECELFDRQPGGRFTTRREAKLAVFDYLETFYNPRRRHSALGHLAPAMFVARHTLTTAA